MDVRYQFFISSTFDDLRAERQQVIQAVLELDHMPVGMEIFPSADEAPWDIVRRTIEASDYYVVLSAGRYGSIFSNGTSFTEREFDLAVELGVPIIGFVHRAPNDLPQNRREEDSEARQRLEAFHGKIRQRHVRTWLSEEELGLQASKAIIYATKSQPRIGWVRADQARSNVDLDRIEHLTEELKSSKKRRSELEKENKDLTDFLRKSVLPDEKLSPSLLAQGDDLFDFTVAYKKDGRREEVKIPLTWDECFSAIAPQMFGVTHFGTARGVFDFESPLKTLLRRKVKLEGPTTVSYDRSEMDKIIFQFKQLGLIHLSKAGGRTGWTLTPAGEAHITWLLTKRRPDDALSPNAP